MNLNQIVFYVRDFVDTFSSIHFTSSTVLGVHIRAFDEIYDWEVVPPIVQNTKTSSKALRFDETGSISNFLSIASKFLEKFPGAQLFISSNSQLAIQEVKSALMNARVLSSENYFSFCVSTKHFVCDSNILIGAGETSRASVQNVQSALIDFLLLSKSTLLVHTRSSSFAREAAFIHSVPILDIFQNHFIYSNDVDLPNYGLDEYLRSDTRNKIYCYDEPDDRQMCSRLITLFICYEKIKSWGLPLNTYCNIEQIDGTLLGSDVNVSPNGEQQHITATTSVLHHQQHITATTIEKTISVLAESNGYSITAVVVVDS